MTQNTSSAVMQQRAPASTEDVDEQRAIWRKLDFFPTPPWAARAGLELIKQIEERRGMNASTMTMLEPAAGEGHIADPAREYFASVFVNDIHCYPLHGYNRSGHACWGEDFLTWESPPKCDWIITNPPFMNAADFVERGLQVATRGVAVLCRQAFIESAKRFKLLFGQPNPLTVFAPFAERVPMQLGEWDPQGSTATAYAWFIWHKPVTQMWPLVMAIPPGTRARLTKPDDVARFARKAETPLLDQGSLRHEPIGNSATEVRIAGDAGEGLGAGAET